VLALWIVCSVVNGGRAPRLAIRDRPSPSKPVIPLHWRDYNTDRLDSQTVTSLGVYFSSGVGLTQTSTVPQIVVTLSLSKGDGLKNGHFRPETASFDRLRMLVGKAR